MKKPGSAYLKKSIHKPGNKHRSAIEGEYAVAVSLFGRRVVEDHLEAMRAGQTKMSLSDLIRSKRK